MMTRTYWLSFVDEERSAGDKHLGSLVVDVTEADAVEAFGSSAFDDGPRRSVDCAEVEAFEEG